MSESPYEFLANRIRELTALDHGFSSLLSAHPVTVSRQAWSACHERYQIITQFQQTALDLFFSSIHGDADPAIAADFFRDLPPSLGVEFHAHLPRERVQPPRFFRTDEADLGTVVEIQCPGSGWGEHSLLCDLYQAFPGTFQEPPDSSLANAFNQSLRSSFGSPPVIQHFLENASTLGSNLLHVAYSRMAPSAPTYWGYDADVRALDCNFVRTHLFVSLLAENFTRPRLERFARGELFYDLPPVCLFEQKLLLALPFEPNTAAYFSDNIRRILPFASAVRDTTISVSPGQQVTVDEFVAWPPSKRTFFLKYAGIDPSRNWGSMAVFDCGGLSRKQLRDLFATILADVEHGRGLWILQAAHSMKQRHEVIDQRGEVVERPGYVKYSTFNSPAGFLGGYALFRPSSKVHGQPETARALLIRDVA